MRRYQFVFALLCWATAAQAQTLPNTPNTSPKHLNTGAITSPTVPTVATPEAQKLLAQPNTMLLDVRTPEEYAAGHLVGAENLNFSAPDFASRLAHLDPSKVYVLYCRSGNRSNQAGLVMQEKGFQQVLNAGAYETLVKKGLKK